MFLIGHLAGNLLFLAGPDAFNEYSHKLISNPLIYVVELGLVAVFFLHVVKTVAGCLGNRAARPTRYAPALGEDEEPQQPQERGVVHDDRHRHDPPLFVVTHLATFKFGDVLRGRRRHPRHLSPAAARCSAPGYVVFYLVAMAVIFFHLWHGVSSAAQSLGVRPCAVDAADPGAGRVLAVVIAGGFFIIPIYTFILSRGAL